MNPDLDAAILAVLQRTAEAWAPLDRTRFSAGEEQAVALLTAAGLTERRIALRLRMAGEKESIEAVITVTGEKGLGQALEGVLVEAWGLWEGEIHSRKAKPDGPPAVFECTRTRHEEMRLTELGAKFVDEVKAGERRYVLDFVYRTGMYGPDSPLILHNPANFIPGVGRKSVLGHGHLESIEITRQGEQSVKVTNLNEISAPLVGIQELLRQALSRRAEEPSAAKPAAKEQPVAAPSLPARTLKDKGWVTARQLAQHLQEYHINVQAEAVKQWARNAKDGKGDPPPPGLECFAVCCEKAEGEWLFDWPTIKTRLDMQGGRHGTVDKGRQAAVADEIKPLVEEGEEDRGGSMQVRRDPNLSADPEPYNCIECRRNFSEWTCHDCDAIIADMCHDCHIKNTHE